MSASQEVNVVIILMDYASLMVFRLMKTRILSVPILIIKIKWMLFLLNMKTLIMKS